MLAAMVNTSWLLFWWSSVPVAVRARGIIHVFNVAFLSPSRQKLAKSLTIDRHRQNPCSECDRCASVRCSWRLKSCYYRSRKNSHTVLSYCTPLEMLDVFRLCVVAELSVAPASSSPLVPDIVNTQHPRAAPNTPAIPLRPSPGLLSIHVPRPLSVTSSAIYSSV